MIFSTESDHTRRTNLYQSVDGPLQLQSIANDNSVGLT